MRRRCRAIGIWNVVDPRKQAEMKLLSRFVPGGGFVMMLMTREGVPLFGGPANDIVEVTHFVDGVREYAGTQSGQSAHSPRPRALPRSGAPRRIRAGEGGAVAVVRRFSRGGSAAKRHRENRGRLEWPRTAVWRRWRCCRRRRCRRRSAPALSPREAIKKMALFVPVIEQGVPVPGDYRYSLTVGPADKQRSADAAWVNGDARSELPLKSWSLC